MLPKKSGPEEPKQKKLFPLFDYLCVRFSYMVPIVHARLPARQIKVAFLLASVSFGELKQTEVIFTFCLPMGIISTFAPHHPCKMANNPNIA